MAEQLANKIDGKIEPEKSTRYDKLAKKYGEEMVARYIELELESASRENGKANKEKLNELKSKLGKDNLFQGIFYQAVERRLRRREDGIRSKEIKRLATRDPLTKLLNRRGFGLEVKKRLAGIKRAEENGNERRKKDFWVFLIDLDKFKEINDNYGHEAGNLALAGTAKVLRDTLRKDRDILARWGGDEFIAVIDEGRASRDGILKLADRLRKNIAQHKFQGEVSITVSIGVAKYDYSGKIDNTESAADGGLYIAKGEKKQVKERKLQLAKNQTIPRKEKAKNQIFYLDSKTDEYSKYESEEDAPSNN